MTAPAFVIRDATGDDAARIAEIYRYFVTDTVVTFEIDDVPCEVMGARVARVQEAGRPWLVIEDRGMVQGFANAAPFSRAHRIPPHRGDVRVHRT